MNVQVKTIVLFLVVFLLVILVLSSCGGVEEDSRTLYLKCYSSGELIYEGIGSWDMGHFVEQESGDRYYIRNADCVSKVLSE